ncbi:HD-GYP domain-containing protein [Sulfuritalea hydrogenivorans]|uniref:Metal dependent phosphohydrolase n=1 Tax=Sulfuritalea hydrogenivorans sk43H TaxID=1223802 RepID=W0SAE5_9PROT|nr:HD domain-containing phosphohydrolase [Sulfuritalea hydrogenivorans]BAO27966.1 metal dependent phosphohydrolase [Sulfuritalea hydrogenivorans sk43H]
MKQRISKSELSVGQPIPWDAYDQDGVLLLRRGETVPSQKAIDRLIDSGLFAHKEEPDAGRGHDAAIDEKSSTLQQIVDARRILASILAHSSESGDGFAPRMEKLVQAVRNASESHGAVSLASILLMQDADYRVRHPINVAILSHFLARELSLDDAAQQLIVAAALTMNLGMYEVQEKVDAIPGALNDKLMSMIRRHPELGVERLAKLGVTDEKWLALVRQHHECIDGSGYPAGLAGDATEMGAKIIGLADRFCAMVSVRGYRPPHKPNTAVRDLYLKHGQKIDPVVAATLIRLVGIYPLGTLVRLKTAEVAVVTGAGNGPDTPAVHAVISRGGAQLEVASHRKTHLADFAIEEVLTIDKLKIPIRMASIWGKDAKLA